MKQTWAQFVQHGFGQVWQDRPCGVDFRPVPKGCLFLSNFLSNFFKTAGARARTYTCNTGWEQMLKSKTNPSLPLPPPAQFS